MAFLNVMYELLEMTVDSHKKNYAISVPSGMKCQRIIKLEHSKNLHLALSINLLSRSP